MIARAPGRGPALTLAATVALVSGATYAGPPFTTDDPEPVPHRGWELYLAGQTERTAGSWAGSFPQLEVNYGAVPDVQLHLIVPFEFSAPATGPNDWRLGDTELGLKYRFVHERESTPQIGTFPLVELPTGGSGNTRVFLPLWLQKSFGRWTTYGGGGYWINPGQDNRNWVYLGWQVQRQITELFTAGAELFHTTPQAVGEESETRFNVGVMFDFSETQHLIASAGRALAEPNEFQAYVAYLVTPGAHGGAEAMRTPLVH